MEDARHLDCAQSFRFDCDSPLHGDLPGPGARGDVEIFWPAIPISRRHVPAFHLAQDAAGLRGARSQPHRAKNARHTNQHRWRQRLLEWLSWSRARRHLCGTKHHNELATGRRAVALEAAGRRRVCVFAIAHGRAFTIEQRRDQEVVAAYDLSTGRELWTNSWRAEFQEPLGGDGPRATPAWDDGKVYALGALGELRCLEADSGKVLWGTNVLDENRAPVLTYGVSASPLIHEDKLMVAAGGPRKHSVVAYAKSTGKKIWGSLDDGAAYSSPMIADLAGERQLLVVTRTRAVGLNIPDGALLWQFPWVVLQGNRNIAQPVVASTNRVFLSAGYGTGCVLIEVTRAGGRFVPREVWRNKNLKNKFTSSVFVNGALFGLDEDILTVSRRLHWGTRVEGRPVWLRPGDRCGRPTHCALWQWRYRCRKGQSKIARRDRAVSGYSGQNMEPSCHLRWTPAHPQQF